MKKEFEMRELNLVELNSMHGLKSGLHNKVNIKNYTHSEFTLNDFTFRFGGLVVVSISECICPFIFKTCWLLVLN